MQAAATTGFAIYLVIGVLLVLGTIAIVRWVRKNRSNNKADFLDTPDDLKDR